MGRRMSRRLVVDALRMAVEAQRPAGQLVHHSDRGGQYSSDDFPDGSRHQRLRQQGQIHVTLGYRKLYRKAQSPALATSTRKAYICAMSEERINRRLAAILAADVVGYSKMMAADEAGTLSALRSHREVLFNPAVERHRGRVVKLMGDGTLVEFSSVVDAVKCALEIQLRAAEQQSVDSAITLRIGVNLGDVIIDGDDIYGDGVNIAARLEPLAEPGGVCIASIVNESVGSRIDIQFEDGGDVRVKNIDRPIRVWKWKPGARALPQETVEAVESADEPATASIAVLPFNNMSGDPEQEYFSDGITEDLITDLSKVSGLMVIARNSSFAYKGQSPDIRVVGRELGVTSVLEGSIRKAGNRVRITAQLIDATTGAHVWADRFDRDLTDIFEVQDEVAQRIVEALKVTLTPTEEALITDNSTANTQAHDLFLKAREVLSGEVTREAVDEARGLYEGAIKLDPNYADPYAGIGATYGLAFNNNWADDAEATAKRADDFATKAVSLAPNDAYGHSIMGWTAGLVGDFERSRKAIDRALELAPNDAGALISRGAMMIFSGDPAGAIADVERARRLDPANTGMSVHFLGLAHLLLGRYETAAVYFKERILFTPGTDLSRAMLASTLGHLGESDEAQRVWAEVMEINPDYSFEVHRGRMPFVNPADADTIAEGLGKAGLPH
jgi:adenylate cyclase